MLVRLARVSFRHQVFALQTLVSSLCPGCTRPVSRGISEGHCSGTCVVDYGRLSYCCLVRGMEKYEAEVRKSECLLWTSQCVGALCPTLFCARCCKMRILCIVCVGPAIRFVNLGSNMWTCTIAQYALWDRRMQSQTQRRLFPSDT
jgi:hypothetical protein